MPKPKLNLKNVSIALNTQSSPEADSRISSTLEQLQQPSRNIFRIGNIPLDKIRRNTKNEYPIIELDKLQQSILTFGLIEPLSVHFISEEDMYELESGERRFTAIQNLINKYTSDDIDKTSAQYQLYRKNVEQFLLNGLPCKIENEAHPLYSEARLIIANNEKRSDDPVFQSKMTSRLAELYTLINAELPENERFSINEKIAEDLNLGTRQVIRNKQFGSLNPDLQSALIKDKGINEGSRYHVLSQEAQEQLAKDIQKTGVVPDLETAKDLYENSSTSDLKSLENSDSHSNTIPGEHIDAITKQTALKKAMKSLSKSIDKTLLALAAYENIDPSVLKSLKLDPPSDYRKTLEKMISDFKSL